MRIDTKYDIRIQRNSNNIIFVPATNKGVDWCKDMFHFKNDIYHVSSIVAPELVYVALSDQLTLIISKEITTPN